VNFLSIFISVTRAQQQKPDTIAPAIVVECTKNPVHLPSPCRPHLPFILFVAIKKYFTATSERSKNKKRRKEGVGRNKSRFGERSMI
jgi:hypothetical protein